MTEIEKRQKTEKKMAVIMFICIFLGITCDILVANDIVFRYVENLRDVTMTLLQIQVTITTLTIAIIALLSGNISDSYMGVSVTEYVLDIRPKIFKQRNVIIIEFVLLVIGIVGQIWGGYNVVIFISIVSILIVLESIYNVYFVFKGQAVIYKEIDEYIKRSIENDGDIIAIAENYISDWEKTVGNDSAMEFEKQVNLFKKITEMALEKGKYEEIEEVHEEMALYLLQNESEFCKKRGIEFVYQCYYTLERWLLNREKQVDAKYQLIYWISREWYLAMESLAAEEVEPILKWQLFADSVTRVDVLLSKNEKDDLGGVLAVSNIARSFGMYIKEQKAKGNLVEEKIWEDYVGDRYILGASRLPEEKVDKFLFAKACNIFNYCKGMLLNGQYSIVKNAIFLDGLSNLYLLEHQTKILEVLSIHAFMYYLAYREGTDCIDEAEQNSIKEILLSDDVRRLFKSFLYRMAEHLDLVDDKLENSLEKMLVNHELFPKHSNVKKMILDNVIREYYLFIILYIARGYYEEGLISQALNTDRYRLYLELEKTEKLEIVFETMLPLVSEDSNQNIGPVDAKVSEMISLFHRIKREELREELKKEVKKAQEIYEAEEKEKYLQKKVEEFVTKKFNQLFGPMIKKRGLWIYTEKIEIYRCVAYTKYISDNINNNHLADGLGYFVDWLGEMLLIDGKIEKFILGNKEDDDDKLITCLKTAGVETIVGSSYVFSSNNYRNWKKRETFLKEYKSIFVNMAHTGLGIKKNAVALKLNSVEVCIYDPELEDVDVVKDNQTGKYLYNASGVILEFDEQELRDYLKNERKIIDVNISVSIGIKGENPGVMIVKGRKDEMEF